MINHVVGENQKSKSNFMKTAEEVQNDEKSGEWFDAFLETHKSDFTPIYERFVRDRVSFIMFWRPFVQVSYDARGFVIHLASGKFGTESIHRRLSTFAVVRFIRKFDYTVYCARKGYLL